MNRSFKVLLVVLGLLAVCALFLWNGLEALVLFVEWSLAAVVVISLLASLASIAMAFLPFAKVPLRYNLRNLQIRWKTSLATALAFTFVVALLTIMLAFVNGMERLTEGTGQPVNIVVLSEGAVDEAFSTLPPSISVFDLPSEIQNMVRRDQDAEGKSGKLWAVREVYVVANQELSSKTAEERERLLQIRGVDDPVLA